MVNTSTAAAVAAAFTPQSVARFELPLEIGLHEHLLLPVVDRREERRELLRHTVHARSADGDRRVVMEEPVLQIPPVGHDDRPPIGVARAAAIDFRFEEVGQRPVPLLGGERGPGDEHDGLLGIHELHDDAFVPSLMASRYRPGRGGALVLLELALVLLPEPHLADHLP